MAQKEKSQTSEGFISTVRNYIPGLSSSSSPNAEAQTSTASQQGILGYIPGFSSGAADHNNTSTGKAKPSHQGVKDSGEVTSPHKDTVHGSGSDKKGSGEKLGAQSSGLAEKGASAQTDATDATDADKYSSAYQGAGIGAKYSSGRHSPSHDSAKDEQNHAAKGIKPTGTTGSPGRNPKKADEHTASAHQEPRNNDSLTKAQGQSQSQGSKGHSGQQQRADDGVRGAPIEGENVKGYAVSAPVGSGDTNIRSATGEPSGQVSGAHMQYAPEDTDTRDHLGRGTVGHTRGEGDSSFANVKRNVAYGTEHVVTKSSQSHIEHTSTTQL